MTRGKAGKGRAFLLVEVGSGEEKRVVRRRFSDSLMREEGPRRLSRGRAEGAGSEGAEGAGRGLGTGRETGGRTKSPELST
jgi:hypothetical protein